MARSDAAASRAVRLRAGRIGEILDSLFPEPAVPLDHADPFTLLVAVMLSAQTTDVAVNKVTPALFAVAPDPARMAALPQAEILRIIRTIGLAPTKAKHLREAAQMLVTEHGGVVPDQREALEALPGVGRKTASVVLSQAFGHPAFAVDTHIHRLAERWGLSNGKDVRTTERDLQAVFPPQEWNRRHLQIIYFGRSWCPARGHDIERCPICSTLAPKKKPRARA